MGGSGRSSVFVTAVWAVQWQSAKWESFSYKCSYKCSINVVIHRVGCCLHWCEWRQDPNDDHYSAGRWQSNWEEFWLEEEVSKVCQLSTCEEPRWANSHIFWSWSNLCLTGSCGSCYAFAKTGILSHRMCVQSNGTNIKVLSPCYMASCPYEGLQGCGGGIPRYWKYERIEC